MAFGLSRFDLNEITRRIELPEISPDPAKPMTLIVRYLGFGNRDWQNAAFRSTQAKKADAPAVPALTDGAPPAEAAPSETTTAIAQVIAPDPEASEAQARREVAEIVAGPVLVAWENVFEDGVAVPFSIEAAQRLLIEMMEHVRDVWRLRVWDFFTKVTNFRPAGGIDPVDLGKG